MLHNVRMLTALVFLCCSCASASRVDAGRLGEGVIALPYHATWTLLSSDERTAIEELLACSPDELDSLLESDDPRDLGLGVFVAWWRADLEVLLDLSHLLDDDRPTIPRTDIFARRARWVAEGEANYWPRDTKVSEVLSYAYTELFGVRTFGSVAKFDETLGQVEDPSSLAEPWRARLHRALVSKYRWYDPGPLEEVKAEIRQLPPELRWVVLARTPGGSFTEHEMLEEIRRLPASIREAPPEQLTVPGDPLISDKTLQQARARFVKLRDLAALGESAPQEP